MKMTGNTVLITGGATGIGFALAEAFIAAGNRVVVCGRRQERLEEAKNKAPSLLTVVSDISKREGRETLYAWLDREAPDVNILVNNAGILKILDLKKGLDEVPEVVSEIDTTLVAAIYLSGHFIPRFLECQRAAIVNIVSALAYMPMSVVPIYCASKAALHSFSLSLRHQLRDTPIKVFEIIPPIVKTELRQDMGLRMRMGKGIPAADIARETLKGMEDNRYEVAVGVAEELCLEARFDPDQLFADMNT
jgi:uncharacterized oxidoreductase